MANYTGPVTNEVDPISRIEGHLGIAVNVSGGAVTAAYAHGNLWRGFENFLLGREANDAITFVQRICGVCPVPHGMTSTYAVDDVLGYSAGHITFAFDGANGVPAKAVHIRNLVLALEFLMSSITHFYHLAAPSYVQGPAIPPWTPYFANSYYADALESGGRAVPQRGADGFYSADVWSTVIRSYIVALRARRLTFEAGALFAGRMPMTSVYVGGGVTYDGTENIAARCDKMAEITKEVGRFIIQEYVPIALALSVLYPAWDNVHNAGGLGYGSGLGRFLAWGAFPNPSTDGLALSGGVKTVPAAGSDFQVTNKAQVASMFLAGGTHAVPDNLTEDIAHSRYDISSLDTGAYTGTAAYPGDVARTKPMRSNGYTYMKAPRWAGNACEVGPMARMFVMGLFQDNVALATSLGAYYTAYVKTVGPDTGLDPRMIHPDIAVALFRAGLATLTVAPASGSTTDITLAYADPNQVITGAIAGHVIGLVAGLSTMDRLRGRAIESLYLVQQILGTYDKTQGSWVLSGAGANISGTYGDGVNSWAGGWIAALKALPNGAGTTWRNLPIPTGTAQGWGGTEAPRGALMHQCTIVNGKITKYQCIVPTTWNGSPRDTGLNPGAIEKACEGVPFSAAGATFTGQGGGSVSSAGGVEVLRVAQSFDPCIACAVH